MPVDKDKHLQCVLNTHKIKKEQKLLDKHISKKEEVREALIENYGSKLYRPFNSGSYAKHTAINTKFDFDMIAPFKRNAFETLKAMYEDVHDFLYKKYNEEATVRKQKVSIGIEFNNNGDTIKIDVVPGRELVQDKYNDDNDVNLYVYDQFGKLEKGSERLKTNPKAQIANVKDHAEKESLRHNIKLLKVWKVQNYKPTKSFFLELITIKAYDQKDITGGLWDKLKSVLEFIRDKVKTISLPDPGNPSNDVADTLTDNDKSILSDDMKYMIERIEEDSDNIKLYFKENSKHPCEEEKKDSNQYTEKKQGVSAPPAVRFGQYGK